MEIKKIPNHIIINNQDANPCITISNKNKEIMRITSKGEVEWAGKPSQAAEIFINCLQFSYENLEGFRSHARNRWFTRGLKKVLKDSKTMSYNQLIDKLKEEINQRDKKELIQILKDDWDENS